mmetsp:Transcript_18476/g.30799  ORF Transcript_18476/g.30799 Transcript_18476/m.30799 type:complete len:237 (+) Transcript_18476:222-932(+)|eukprot:CAMPEP_0114421578 /NCGR_PEP_ID=MMETSP0103-20121206/5149_1 /TAXON_ID=37642 ORGANISM="Paraphysomonas imperforata, Strain PA2" /NCGR_SAMPLE_ID=MMETSP0103 /ASSEMBLY_ACC=CAM_ASM_000201 /LENGTH=236 /DNA_ID=CAMNT_0001590101 /DNA_START=231 /DNA_END=941 /DNA_ORIENTATION=+
MYSRVRKEPKYAIGQRIEGYLGDEWLPGRVTDHNRDGSFGVRFDDGHEMGDMTEYELRYMEDEVLVAAAKERDRLLQLHTALRHAANHGHVEEAEVLMTTGEGIDVNNKDGSGWSALAWACKMGRLDVARYLLSVGADIDSTDKNLDTPLMWACRKNQIEVVDFLVVANAFVDNVNELGWTALMEASVRGYNECLSILLHKKARTDFQNNEGKTAGDIAKTSTTLGLIKAADGEYY